MKKIITYILIFFTLSYSSFAEETGDEFISTSSEGEVVLTSSLKDEDILIIDINAQNMKKSVLGIAFHLSFNNENFKFLRYEPGDFLEMGGDPFYLVEIKGNKVIFGESLRKDDKFPMGDGIIAKLYFEVIKKDRSVFEFSNNVISTLEVVKQDLQNIQWTGLILDENLENIANLENVLTSQAGENVYIEGKDLRKESFFEKHKILFITLSIASAVVIFTSFYYLNKNKKIATT